jgi:hydrogenase small subunit
MKKHTAVDVPLSTLASRRETRDAQYGFSRRDFFRWAVAATAITKFNAEFLPRLGAAVRDAVKEYPIIWMQGQSCSGCSVSALNTVHPSIKKVLLDELLPGHQLILNFHPTLMAATGSMSVDVVRETVRSHKGKFILILEGAVPIADDGLFCTVGDEDGQSITTLEWIRRLAPDALAVLAVGTCAAFGGVAAAKPNPTVAKGLGDILEMEGIATPLLNIPGCPAHPDWFLGTVAHVLLYGLPEPHQIDEMRRLKTFYGRTVHERCTRRDDMEEGIYASKLGEGGCLLAIGCKGPFAYGDCPSRRWNSRVNWCISANGPCLGCTEPAFPDGNSPLYQRV